MDFRNIFKWSSVVLGIIGLLAIIHFAQSCGPIKNIVTINDGNNKTSIQDKEIEKPSSKIEDAIKKTHGPDTKIKGVIKVDTKQGEDKSKKIKTTIVLIEDPKCNTCNPKVAEVTEESTYLGFSFKPKFYIGMTATTPTIGYAQEFFRWGKLSSNLTLGVPTAGLGTSYDITNNFYGIVGANIRYLEYKEVGDISSYNIDASNLTKIYPMIGVGFYF